MSDRKTEELIKEIQENLKRVSKLERKLEGKDKETFQWLISGYNECATMLNQKTRLIYEIDSYIRGRMNRNHLELNQKELNELLDILKEVE